MVHLYHHEGAPEAEAENTVTALYEHLRWDEAKVAQVRAASLTRELITEGPHKEKLFLTPAGRALAREVLEPWRGR